MTMTKTEMGKKVYNEVGVAASEAEFRVDFLTVVSE